MGNDLIDIVKVETTDFRTLEEGSLMHLVEGAQPVVFERILEGNSAILVFLDPIEGLCKRRYPLNDLGQLGTGYKELRFGRDSREGQRYLNLITG